MQLSLGYIDFIYYSYIPSRRFTKFYGSNNISFKYLKIYELKQSPKSVVASHFSKLSFSNGEMSQFSFLVAMTNNVTEKNFRGKEVLISSYTLQSSVEKGQSKNSRQEPRGRDRGRNRERMLLLGLPDLLPQAYSAVFLIQLQPTYLGMALPTVGWALQHQLAIKKMPADMHTSKPNGNSSSVKFPSSHDCQVGK